MLILTRRAGEAILIDGGVRIVVLGTDGGGVRLGIEAPQSVGIMREEVLSRAPDGDEQGRPTGAPQGISGVHDGVRGGDDAPVRRESGEEDRGLPEE
jgi:carbon storage regulator